MEKTNDMVKYNIENRDSTLDVGKNIFQFVFDQH